MVQPLHADLLAGAVAHGLLDIVAGLVGEQAVDPDAELILGLVAELLLTVQRPAQQPVDDTNESLEAELNTLLDQLSTPSVRNLIFAVADALIGGQPVPISSGGGGSTSALPWDGRRPDEEEEAYRRRCLLHASLIVKAIRSGYRRR